MHYATFCRISQQLEPKGWSAAPVAMDVYPPHEGCAIRTGGRSRQHCERRSSSKAKTEVAPTGAKDRSVEGGLPRWSVQSGGLLESNLPLRKKLRVGLVKSPTFGQLIFMLSFRH